MSKPLRKALDRLSRRQAGYDTIRDAKTKKAMKRPGSMNSHKSMSKRSGPRTKR